MISATRTPDARLMGLFAMVFTAGCPNQVEGLGGAGATEASDASQSAAQSSTRGASGATKASTQSQSTNSIIATSAYGHGPTTSGEYPCDGLACDACLDCASNEICQREIASCFASKACTALNECVGTCPADDPVTTEDEELLCICGVGFPPCPMQAPVGTCLGDHPDGVAALELALGCLSAVCDASCD